MKFYICKHCGNIAIKVKDVGVPLFCCGEKMEELVPGTTDAATEKHIPVYHKDGNKVTVKIGEVEHPMTAEHYIEWVILETCGGTYYKKLEPGDKPELTFTVNQVEEVQAVYAYCNLHSLWKA